MMKPLITFLASRTGLIMALTLFTAAAFGQVDFTAKWKLAPSKSKLNAEFSMAPKELVITHTENQLTIERHSEFQDQQFTIIDKFTLDGKECINEGWQGSKKKSTVVWSDDTNTLIIKSKLAIDNGGEVKISETYQLDGTTLSVATEASSDWGDSKETYVFDKQ